MVIPDSDSDLLDLVHPDWFSRLDRMFRKSCCWHFQVRGKINCIFTAQEKRLQYKFLVGSRFEIKCDVFSCFFNFGCVSVHDIWSFLFIPYKKNNRFMLRIKTKIQKKEYLATNIFCSFLREWVGAYVCVRYCEYVCVCECMFACDVSMWESVCVCVCVWVCVCVCIWERVEGLCMRVCVLECD